MHVISNAKRTAKPSSATSFCFLVELQLLLTALLIDERVLSKSLFVASGHANDAAIAIAENFPPAVNDWILRDHKPNAQHKQ